MSSRSDYICKYDYKGGWCNGSINKCQYCNDTGIVNKVIKNKVYKRRCHCKGPRDYGCEECGGLGTIRTFVHYGNGGSGEYVTILCPECK